MGMTDPVADMLTRIRNASRARHESLEVPWSRIKEGITRVLVEEGYLQEARKVKTKKGGGEQLHIQLKFDKENNPIISGLRRVSRPSLRIYKGAKKIPPIRKGLGINILSTPKGILVDREAQKAKVGGELLCSVW
ncbi:MAG: 30S ribosomal protein S8 [Candidatus Binatia bacterium]